MGIKTAKKTWLDRIHHHIITYIFLKEFNLIKILKWAEKRIISKILESIITLFSALLLPYVHLLLPYSNGKKCLIFFICLPVNK